MKTRSSKNVRFLSLLCLAVWVAGPRASAQTPAGLDLRLYAGLTITGAVGTVYSVEYVTDMAQTNNAGAWRCLEFLQLPASPYLWADKSAPATDKRFYRAVVFAASTNLVFIPPGTFRMGSPTNDVDRSDNEGPQTSVTISRGCWMGKYEVTQGQYLAVMGNNPSYFSTNNGFAEDQSRPVELVSWNDATAYCDALTQWERAAGRIATNGVYRLPTEAEWEYACRGWTSTRFNYGDDEGYTNLTNYAWYEANSGETTHPVGQKLSNPWGLYDMHGNVWEWCQDWSDAYPGGIALDPQGPASGSCRGDPRRQLVHLARQRQGLPVSDPLPHHAGPQVQRPRFPGSAGPRSALSRAVGGAVRSRLAERGTSGAVPTEGQRNRELNWDARV